MRALAAPRQRAAAAGTMAMFTNDDALDAMVGIARQAMERGKVGPQSPAGQSGGVGATSCQDARSRTLEGESRRRGAAGVDGIPRPGTRCECSAREGCIPSEQQCPCIQMMMVIAVQLHAGTRAGACMHACSPYCDARGRSPAT